LIVATLLDTEDYWDGCTLAHTMMDRQVIAGADDFQLEYLDD
jgi:hypothetical protein